MKLAGRVQQHVRGSLGTSDQSQSHLAARADQRTGEFDRVGARVGKPYLRAGAEQRIRRRSGPPGPVELLADFGRGDLGRLPDVPAPVHVHVQAALLEPVDVLRGRPRVVQYLGDLSQGRRDKGGLHAGRGERHCGDQLARDQLHLVPLEHPPDRRPRPHVLRHGRQGGQAAGLAHLFDREPGERIRARNAAGSGQQHGVLHEVTRIPRCCHRTPGEHERRRVLHGCKIHSSNLGLSH